jgi:hypothetical protein
MFRCSMVVLTMAMSILPLTSHGAGVPEPGLTSETVTLDGDPSITLKMAWRPGVVAKHPVILMLGAVL